MIPISAVAAFPLGEPCMRCYGALMRDESDKIQRQPPSVRPDAGGRKCKFLAVKLRLFLSSLLLASACQPVFAQQVQWASKVIAFSTEGENPIAPKQYSAVNVLGSPSVTSSFGLSPAAWSPATKDDLAEEFIHVGFSQPANIQQVLIHENFSPGAITLVDLIDAGGTAHRVFENKNPQAVGSVGRMLSVTMDRTPYLVMSVKVTLNSKAVSGFNQIDAIGIADHKDKVQVKVNLPPNLQSGFARENLGPNINSPTNEFSPLISPDGKTLYFTRSNHPDNTPPIESQDVWFSEIGAGGVFGPCKPMGLPINTPDNNSVASILPDNNSLLVLNVYKPDGSLEKGISIARRGAAGWDMPKAVRMEDFYNDNQYSEYSLAPSGKVMVATLQRKDGFGSKDLHVSFLKADGSWTEPRNIGAALNTADNETSPFIAADGATMYFSTAGHPGFGRNDMFVTRRLDDTWLNWSLPVNLGPELNTPRWDAYYSMPASGTYAYCVSEENSLGSTDIFRIKLPDALRPKPVVLVSGRTLDKKTGLPIAARIVCENLATGAKLGTAFSDAKDGHYTIVLPGGANYGFLAETPRYASVSANLNLPVLEKFTEIKKDLYLVPLEKGAVIRLNNIFFDTNKAVLKPTSFPELDRVVTLMNQQPTLKIAIAGHTDSDASDAYNLELSRKRATAVSDYLTKQGVNAGRLSSKGFGESMPQVPNTTAENKAVNRRVEFTILEL